MYAERIALGIFPYNKRTMCVITHMHMNADWKLKMIQCRIKIYVDEIMRNPIIEPLWLLKLL